MSEQTKKKIAEILIKFSAMLTNIAFSISAKAIDDEACSREWMQTKVWQLSRLPEYVTAMTYQGRHEA